jgi:hypothetical protein
MVGEFDIAVQNLSALNGGPHFRLDEAIWFQKLSYRR